MTITTTRSYAQLLRDWADEVTYFKDSFKPERYRWLMSITRIGECPLTTAENLGEDYLRKLDVISGYIYALNDTDYVGDLVELIQDIKRVAWGSRS